MAYNEVQLFIVELVGTALSVLFGLGAIANALLPGTKGHGFGFMGIAPCFGFGVFVALQAVGHVSGKWCNQCEGGVLCSALQSCTSYSL